MNSRQEKAARIRLATKVNDLKSRLGCAECKTTDYRVLHFHHIDPAAKSFNISDMVRRRYGWKKILEEIAKCECLCANCHLIREHEVKGWETYEPA